MKVFVFDTETTGFPVKDGELSEQPYIIQFAGIFGEIQSTGEFQETCRINQKIKPRILIPFASSKVHGIFDKDVVDCPYFEEVVDDFLKLTNSADIVVGHNVEFDEEVLRWELARIKRKGEYQPSKSVCTMRSSVDFCQLQGRGFSFKMPKLNEVYLKLFGERFAGAHDAMNDVEATTKVFVELVKKSVITLEENKVLRLF